MDTHPRPSPTVNYIYFGFFFLLLALMAINSVLTKEDLSGSRIFFFLYSVGQSALEISLFILLSSLAARFIGRKTFLFFIGASFLLFILHGIDFLLDRIFDLSIWNAISLFLIDETLENFLYLLEATGVPLWVWVIAFGGIAALPLFGVFLYQLTDRLAKRKPLPFRGERFLIAVFCLPAALLFWDYSASRALHPDAYTAFLQSLPWKSTFLQPNATHFALPGPLKEPLAEAEIAKSIAASSVQLTQRPNIYLFVVESLRRDIITQETAPHLWAFKRQAAPFSSTYSNGNGSHLAWFSIFHSQHSYLWSHLQSKGWEMGSPPLRLLKKWGYQIRIYSSAQLNYYSMEKLLFGKEANLADSYQTFPHVPPLEAADSDANALAKLQKDLADNPSLQEGQVFIVFWDATHFNYSWPESWSPKFLPIAKEFAYFKAFFSHEPVDHIKNRYKNAVHYIDSLFGNFMQKLPRPEEAIVIVTGDHGEEFFERGHLFHNSHLSREQTHIPLFMKFGSKKIAKQKRIVSQMDIFPSILDAIGGEIPSFIHGESVLREAKWPFAIISRFNAGRSPYEFCIHNGKYKLIAHFPSSRNIFLPGEMHIRSIRTDRDTMLPETARDVKQWIESEFGAAIEKLFPRGRLQNLDGDL